MILYFSKIKSYTYQNFRKYISDYKVTNLHFMFLSDDASDCFYGCLWDVNILEYLICILFYLFSCCISLKTKA